MPTLRWACFFISIPKKYYLTPGTYRALENYGIVILIMALMIGASGLAGKLRLPVPVLLIVVGMVAGSIPAIPSIMLDPHIVMLIFLPPLLYDAAFFINFKEFRTNINTIG